MLRVSSKGRYGVKAVYELASRYGRGPVTVPALARAQNLPDPYLEQLMPLLKRAGIVEALRGPQGGYILAKPPSQVTVGDVVRAVEGPIAITDCTSEDPRICPEVTRCVGPDVWSRVQAALIATMDAITFADLVQSTAREWAEEAL
ncbi:MAG: Rrf2 family transcriptional regulator [Firmicutes bacterium]|nr:Rrf2 family transcriptional regulator [Alicyclobacillaceae bacterium]MCL6496624.1 Rrf2 family transcriptional regulator [Bacillota bacterium]